MRLCSLTFWATRRGASKPERLESAIDGLRRRFGHQIVRRAVVLTDGQYAQINPKEEHTVHPVPFYAG